MALTVVAIIGILTALFAATIGMAQTDIKKVLAYSTISQLGYMFLACGVAAYSAGIFHLMTHAFFKGLLFLAAGSVIHAVSGEQDLRKMGGLLHRIPWTFWTMTMATFAISGVPFFSGFFSKDEILWKVYSQGNWVFWLLGILTALLTSFYMFRLWFMTFFGEYRGPSTADRAAPVSPGGHRHGDIHESPTVMLVPLVLLAVLSVVGGYLGVPEALGGTHRFEKFLAPVFHADSTSPGAEGVGLEATQLTHGSSRDQERVLTTISVVAASMGFFLAWLLYYQRRDLPGKITQQLGGFYQAVANKYWVDELYGVLFVKPLLEGSSRWLWRGMDQGMIDTAIDDAADSTRDVSDAVRHMQSGNLRSYAGWVAGGAALVIAYMIWMGTR
jgi:NADH-quinone oxidoreductase subunit L